VAEYAITAANVNPGGVQGTNIIAGEALQAGDFFYQHTDGKAYKAKADTDANAYARGMCINSAAAGQPIAYVTSGEVTVDNALFPGVGRLLVISKTTAGRLMDAADLAAGNRVCIAGWTTAANKLYVALSWTAKTYA